MPTCYETINYYLLTPIWADADLCFSGNNPSEQFDP